MLPLHLFIILLSMPGSVFANSSGAPSSVCGDWELKPGHGTGYTRGGNFTISVSATEFVPGSGGNGKLVIGLSNIQSTVPFKGFIVMAKILRSFEKRAVGELIEVGGITKQVCHHHTGHGLTHSSGFRRQRRIEIEWKPPTVCQAKDIQDIRFQATFVESYEKPPTILVYSDIVKMKPLDNDILCAHECGVNCPTEPPVTLPPCPKNMSDPFRVDFSNCTIKTEAVKQGSSALRHQLSCTMIITCFVFILLAH